MAIVLSALVSYLLGSCNSSILVVRLLKHQDVRNFGSHNAGLTNTLRCFGKGCAALTLIGDLAKGIIAVFLSRGICHWMDVGLTAQQDVHFIGYIAGIFAILDMSFLCTIISVGERACWSACRSFWELIPRCSDV